MQTYIILSEKKWHTKLYESLQKQFADDRWILIDRKEDFTLSRLKELNPSSIFIPHWSYIIPEEIFSSYECIVFHMTDLPFGRGGSPLQNLIVRGFQSTQISAIKVDKGIDTGDIYLKSPLQLTGSAMEIFEQMIPVIESMIKKIILEEIIPVPQTGEATIFQRRTPEQSNISQLENISEIYDYIRMLDADGYPKAFTELNGFRFEFENAQMKGEEIIAHVRIFKK